MVAGVLKFKEYFKDYCKSIKNLDFNDNEIVVLFVNLKVYGIILSSLSISQFSTYCYAFQNIIVPSACNQARQQYIQKQMLSKKHRARPE